MEFYIVSLFQFMLQFLVHGLVHFIIMIIFNTYFMYISFFTVVASLTIQLGTFQIIGDHKRKSGKFELGTRLYTATTCNKSVYKGETELLWFIQMDKIISFLNQPKVECISPNRVLYYFDDL